MKLPKILKSRDLARLLNLSPDSVNLLARKGVIKGHKEGRQSRFRRREVENYLQSLRHEH